MTACSRIQGAIRTMRRCDRGRDLARDVGAGAEAGVDEPAGIELIEHATVIGEVVRLTPHLAVPVETQPLEIGEDRVLVLAPAAADVGIFDPHQETTASLARTVPSHPGRIGRTEM